MIARHVILENLRDCLSDILGFKTGIISYVTFTAIDCTAELTVDIIAANKTAAKQANRGIGS